MGAIMCNGNVEISGTGTLNIINDDGPGIYVNTAGCTAAINGATVTIECETFGIRAPEVDISNGAKVLINAVSYGLYAGTTVGIVGSRVVAKVTSVEPNRYGIYSYGTIIIKDNETAGAGSFIDTTSIYAAGAYTHTKIPTATYTMSASALTSFGSQTVGYGTAPAVQTVTITNTGNQVITLTQPTATDYIIGALDTTSLAVGGTATFTVQPKTALAVEVYAGHSNNQGRICSNNN